MPGYSAKHLCQYMAAERYPFFCMNLMEKLEKNQVRYWIFIWLEFWRIFLPLFSCCTLCWHTKTAFPDLIFGYLLSLKKRHLLTGSFLRKWNRIEKWYWNITMAVKIGNLHKANIKIANVFLNLLLLLYLNTNESPI